MANSRLALYGALGANVAIAATKFIVAGLSGSSVMLSEAIHSTVDTGNSLLMLAGLRLSKRPPSPEHPFGHGRELYFWSFVVAVSALFEGTSFAIALREFKKDIPPGLSFWRALRGSKDPPAYTVVAEDGAALVGLAIAALGIFASHRWQLPALDGLASIAIGALLGGVAVLLIRESRGLLVGEGARPETVKAIKQIALSQPGVKETGPALTMYIGPEEVLLTLDLIFDAGTVPKDS